MNTDALPERIGAHELRCGPLLTLQCICKGITDDLPQVGSGRDDEYVSIFSLSAACRRRPVRDRISPVRPHI